MTHEPLWHANSRFDPGVPDAGPRLRWWNALHFRLALLINLIAVVVLAAFWFIDYRREIAAHAAVETGRLREEARVLRVARRGAADREEFQAFLDEFCAQMGVTVSPGHHIAIFDDTGSVVARAHERADPRLEDAMRSVGGADNRLRFEGQDYLAVQVPSGDGSRIVIAQSLSPIHALIRAQAVSRALSLGLLAVLIFGGTTVFVLRWVRDPLYRLTRGVHAIAQRHFGTRVTEQGSPELRFLAAGVNRMAAALERVERDRLVQMRRAREIQRRLLPDGQPGGSGLGLAAAFEPADSVAGDLYDVIPLADGATLVTVLDVSGHGVAASLYTALLRAVLRAEARRTSDPTEIACTLNRELVNITGRSGEFVTCFLARIEPGRGEVRYVGAGHEPAVLLRDTGDVQLLEGEGLPLGVLGDTAYSAATARLSAGDRLLLYTDGLHEVPGPDGQLFGRERLLDAIRQSRTLSAPQQVTVIVERVREHARGAPLADDLTLVCVEPADGAPRFAQDGDVLGGESRARGDVHGPRKPDRLESRSS